MPAPTDDDGVVPLRLQPVVERPRGWRGRSGPVVAVLLAGFVLTAFVLGRTLDTAPSEAAIAAIPSEPAASATTAASPPPAASLEPEASALPARLVIGGRIPTERRLVYANGVQVLDLATGLLVPTTRPMYDRMLPVADDQLVCACSLGGIPIGETPVPPSVRFGRYDLTGTAIVERDVVSLGDVVPVPNMSSGFDLTSALNADRTTLYVLVATRRPPNWSIDLYAVDVRTGKLVGHALLGRVPVAGDPSPAASPSPGDVADPGLDGVYVWVNALAVAPDGGTVYASVGDVDYRGGVWNADSREWMVPLRTGKPGKPIRITADRLGADDWCVAAPQFVDRNLLVQACATGPTDAPDATYHLRRLGADGTALGDLPIPGFPPSRQSPTDEWLDRAGRSLYLWDSVRHVLGRIDVDTGAVATGSAAAAGPLVASPADGPMGIGADSGLVAAPDGTRLYALGLLPNGSIAGRSTGVWVFDTQTLELRDHWPAMTRLTSLAVSADGTFVYATGAQGFDATGRQGGQAGSVTVYDAATGEIQVLYGAVSPETWIAFPTWP